MTLHYPIVKDLFGLLCPVSCVLCPVYSLMSHIIHPCRIQGPPLYSEYPPLHCTALHCNEMDFTALQYISLHCTALRCTALHCTALHCIAMHCTALHCIALHCTALHCIALYCTALHCIALHCTALNCTALHYTALYSRPSIRCLYLASLPKLDSTLIPPNSS